MNAIGGVGGPVGQPMMHTGTPRSAPTSNDVDNTRTLFHTYIYEYFLKTEQYDIARILHERVEIRQKNKQSPDRKEVNGDAMEEDMRDNMPGRPADLPLPHTPPSASDSSFLFDWWCQFWDCFHAQRGRGDNTTKQYLNHVQQQTRMANDRQRMIINHPQMQNNMGMRMMPNGMNGMDMKKAAMQGNRFTPQQIQQMQQQGRLQQQMIAANQMQREGSSMDINGQPRPQTPGSGDQPSPKRQRLTEGFNGQMGPMGRGQPQNMQGQQFNALQMPNSQAQAKSMQVYAQTMRQHAATAMDPESQKGMPANGFPQGSPALEANGEFMNGNQMRGMPTGAPNGQNNNSNLALQDYQMQLMLLEQQNKKRLLMARQEQDSVTNGQGGPMPGQPGFVAPAMSPSNSRTGPSPNPDDQMKRGTPKMAPTGMPTNPDGSMAQGRGSPAPGQFDPSQMPPGMAPNMFQQMRMPGIMGPNGQIMPATSHPAFNGQMNGQMTPQQMEIMRRQGQAPNGPWQQGLPPGMMPGGQPQQPPNMTPQQRNAAMPPPPAPGPGEGSAQRTQPSSPSQSTAAPPTPSQTNKANPKGKKDAPKNNKKAAGKKGGANTGSISEAGGEQPPTPTPGPPITPTAPQFNKSTGSQGPNPQQVSAQNAMSAQASHVDPMLGAFPGLDNNDPMPDFTYGTLDGTDVLDNFDFESFLNNDATDASFNIGGDFTFDGGLEAGGDV